MSRPLVTLCVALAAGSAQAGGLYIQEFGTPTQATATAGAQAKANDASTAFHNPAGMTRLDDHALMLAGGLLIGDIKFDVDDDSPTSGGNGGQQGGPGPVIGGSYVHSLFERDSEWLDRVRFGSLTFLAAGERIRLKGDYHYGGKLLQEISDHAAEIAKPKIEVTEGLLERRPVKGRRGSNASRSNGPRRG